MGETIKKPEVKDWDGLSGMSRIRGQIIMSIVKGYDLPIEFPEKGLNQAERGQKMSVRQDMARGGLGGGGGVGERISETGRW